MTAERDSELPVVLMSARLGAIGPIEARIAYEGPARLATAELWTEEQLIANGANADVLILGASEPVTERVLAALPSTRCIVRRGVGVDNVDVAAATRQGIGVAFIPDASVEEVSDHALALLLAAERRIVAAHAATQAGDLPSAGAAVGEGRRFADLTLGVVGFGRIGRALAGKARSVFGAVVAHDPWTDAASTEIELLQFNTLLQRSNLVSLHANAQADGPPLFDAGAFAQAAPGLVLVNTARGRLVDESALLAALDCGQVAAAALDVTTAEPLPADHPLRRHPQVLLTGHTAAKGTRSSRSLREGVVEATLRTLHRELPAHLSNPELADDPQCRITKTEPMP